MAEPPIYKLSENQQKFIEDAKEQGLDVDYGYSGRFMYGKCCPAVRVDNPYSFKTESRVEVDSMGLGFVVYARF